MDEWNSSRRADELREVLQESAVDEARKAAGTDTRHGHPPGPLPKSVVLPLTPEMKAVLRNELGARKGWAIRIAASIVLIALVAAIVTGADVIGVVLTAGGVALLVGIPIALWFFIAFRWNSHRGTYVLDEGWIGTSTRIVNTSTTTTERIYILNVGGRELQVHKEVYDAAGTITHGTVAYAGPKDIFEIRDRAGAVVYRDKGYAPAAAA